MSSKTIVADGTGQDSQTELARSRNRRWATIPQYYQSILHSIDWPGAMEDASSRSVGLTSCFRGEGVTTIAANLAISSARLKMGQVVIVDCSFFHPQLHKVFRLPKSPGVAEFVLSGNSLDQCCRRSKEYGLSVIAAGKTRGKTDKIAASARLVDLIDQLRGMFSLIILDLPPASQDVLVCGLGSMLDGVLLVIEAERVADAVAQRTKERLRSSHINLHGAVLNKRRSYLPSWARA